MDVPADYSPQDVQALVHIAKALERKFPQHNDGFAYGTRLCEETGELIDALTRHANKPDVTTAVHLSKEIQDVARVVIGIIIIYGKEQALPRRLDELDVQSYSTAAEASARLAIATGTLANTISHMEHAGVKLAKHGDNVSERMVAAGFAVLSLLNTITDRFELKALMNDQILLAYINYQKAGYIPQN